MSETQLAKNASYEPGRGRVRGFWLVIYPVAAGISGMGARVKSRTRVAMYSDQG